LWNLRWLGVSYTPHPDERSFLQRAEDRQDGDLIVRVSGSTRVQLG